MYLKSTAINAIIALIFTFLAALAGYAFRLVLAHNLTVSDYGLFYAIFSFLGFFTIFIDFGLTQSLAKSIVEFRVKGRYDWIKSVLISCFSLQMAISLLLTVIFLVLTFYTPIINNYFKLDNPMSFLLMLIWFVTLPFDMVTQSFLLGFQRIKLFSAIGAIKALVILFLTLLFLYSGWEKIVPFLSYALINIIIFLLLIPFLIISFPDFFKIPNFFDYERIRKVILYGGLLAFAWLAWSVVTYTDSMIILLFRNTGEVGLYQVALPLAYVLMYFINALNSVTYPLFTRLNTEKNKEKIVQGVNLLYNYIFVGMIPLALIMLSFPEIVIQFLFGAKFLEAANALRILSIATILFSLASFNINLFLATGHAKTIALFAALTAMLNVILNFIFIPFYGFVGASLTTLISFTFLLFATLFKVKRTYPGVSLPLLKWTLNFMAGFLTVGLIWYLKKIIIFNVWIEFAIILLCAGIFYVILLFLLRVIRFEEFSSVIKVIIKG